MACGVEHEWDVDKGGNRKAQGFVEEYLAGG
jgi:hypothetical protein